MQQPFKYLPAWFKRKAIIGIFLILLLVAGVGMYWQFARGPKIEKLNVGGKGNACTCSQRLNQ